MLYRRKYKILEKNISSSKSPEKIQEPVARLVVSCRFSS